MQIINNNI